ncbi:hypothetical protein XU18_4773 [Perkinsela sp. CCAP 1560/4]|nr:hypothetical protein XU18_4773 [Perkinsela sp. CCAP 1560/4]|eukprot:KNH03884.1 hypothetical protein XU18_4773 [Perkinsela sp. CCAP 1560/4]
MTGETLSDRYMRLSRVYQKQLDGARRSHIGGPGERRFVSVIYSLSTSLSNMSAVLFVACADTSIARCDKSVLSQQALMKLFIFGLSQLPGAPSEHSHIFEAFGQPSVRRRVSHIPSTILNGAYSIIE